jgi:hypothetical protein
MAQQGALLAAKAAVRKGPGRCGQGQPGLGCRERSEDEIRTIARLRLAALQADAKQYDEALKSLDSAKAPAFEGLVADRRGDVLMLQGKRTKRASPIRRPTRVWAKRLNTAAWSKPSSSRWACRLNQPWRLGGWPVTVRTAALVCVVLMLGACAADKPKPTPLENYPAKIAGKAVWSTRLNPSILGFSSTRESVLIPTVRDGRVHWWRRRG